MEIWVAHGDLTYLQRSIVLSLYIYIIVPHDLGPKGFYPERDKSDLKA
jgi:hypothetical protein